MAKKDEMVSVECGWCHKDLGMMPTKNATSPTLCPHCSTMGVPKHSVAKPAKSGRNYPDDYFENGILS